MSYKTGFYEGRLGIGLSSTMGMGDGNPRYPLDINGDIRLTGSIVNGSGQVLSLVPQESLWTIGTTNITYTGGNVGIGTASPESMLHLKSSGDVILRLEADSDNSGESDNPMIFMSQDGTISQNSQYFKIGMNGDAGTAFTGALTNSAYLSSNDYLQFAIQGEAVMTMEYQNKNVGIGTTSPYSKLEITAGADKSHIRIADGNHNGSSSTFLYPALTYYARQDNIRRNTDPYTEGVGANGGASASISFADRPGTFNYPTFTRGSDIVFHTAKTVNDGLDMLGYYPRERMRITAEGRVGIGTTSPIGKLQVAESTVDGDLDVVFSAAMDAKCRLVLQRNHGTEHSVIGGSNTIIGDTYYPDWCIENGYDAQAGLKFTSKYKTYPGNVATTNDVMFLDMEGNVGINNTTPSAKLDVNGSIKARGIDGGNIGSKFLVTPVTNGTHNNNNVPSLTGAGNWLEYHPHVDFDFILGFTSPYQMGMQIYLKDKQGNIIQEVGLHVGSTTASSGTYDPGYEGNNVALFVYNPEKKMYEFAFAEYWYNWGNDSAQKVRFCQVIDQAMPTDLIVLNGTGYNSRWMEYESETERLRTHFGSTESPYSGGWSSTLFAGIKGYGKIIEFDTTGRGTERAAAVKIGDIHKWDDIDYSVAWTSDGTPNRTEAAALTSSDFCFMYNKYGGRIAKMKIHAVSDSDRVYVTLADGGSGQTAFSIDNNYAFIWPSKVKQGVEQAGGTWPSGAGTYGGWITMQGGQASYYWTADDGNNYYFAFGNYHAGRRRYMVNGTRNRRDDAWPVGSTRGTNVEIRDTHLTIKKRTDKFDYGNQTRMIEFKPYMSDRWNNSGSEFQPYTVKASINSGISSLRPSLNTETGFIAFHTADDGVLDERMRIEYNGNVGIGTSTPEENAQLHIQASNNRNLRMTTKGGSHPGYQTNFTWGAHHIDVYSTSTIKGFGDTGNGGTMHLNYYSGGSVTGTSGTSITSDDRLKHNEKIITNGLDIINQLEPKKYFKSLKRYDEEHNYDLDSSGNPITDDHYKIETGLIAQQVMSIPELKYLVDEVEDKYKIVNKEKIDESGNVILDDDGKPVIDEEEQISIKGRYTVNYQDIFVYNISATKELYKENQELKTEVATLKSELAAIKQHLGI